MQASRGQDSLGKPDLHPSVRKAGQGESAGSYPGSPGRYNCSRNRIRVLPKHISETAEQTPQQGRTPFLSACYYGNWNCAHQLLEAGSNVFAVDKDGNCALHLAAINGHADVVEQLLAVADHQAITSRLVNVVNLSGLTPLHYAAWAGHADIAQQLLAAGIDPLQSSWGEYDRWLVVPLGSTALHAAALQLKSSVCIILLQHYLLQLCEWLPGDPALVDPRRR